MKILLLIFCITLCPLIILNWPTNSQDFWGALSALGQWANVFAFGYFSKILYSIEKRRSEEEEQRETYNHSRRIILNCRGIDHDYINAIKTIRKKYHRWTWSILRAYEDILLSNENASLPTFTRLLKELSEHDSLGKWPTKEIWDDKFGS
ncbi:hypothetical protein K2X05_08880 [bacterium]|nr:hypothetical protein [bacterium]